MQELAFIAVSGVVDGREPTPDEFMELVFGAEILELEGFMGQVKVRYFARQITPRSYI